MIEQSEIKGHDSLPETEEVPKRPTKCAKPSKETKQSKKEVIAPLASLKRNIKCQYDGNLCSNHGVEYLIAKIE